MRIKALIILMMTLITFSAIATASKPVRVALVLGGGGARGYAHLGVIKVLEQAHIPIDLIVGTSVGSFVGVLYADNPHIKNLDKVFLNTKPGDFIHFSLLKLFQGPFDDKKVQDFFLQHLSVQSFKDLKIKFIAVATDLDSGETTALKEGAIAPAINASSALPPFFEPVWINGHRYIDGGITDPVAVDIAKTYHPKIIIAVDISKQLPPAKITSIMSVLHRSDLIRMKELDNSSFHDADVVIQPNVGQTGVFDSSQKQVLVNAGINETKRLLPRICQLLAERHIKSQCQW